MTRPVRIANCSGFYGDRLAAAREALSGPVDVLTGDYLAELTMLILWKARRKDPALGYAKTIVLLVEPELLPGLASVLDATALAASGTSASAMAASGVLAAVTVAWSAMSLAYIPPALTSSRCVPLSTIVPWSMTTIRSALMILERRCAMMSVVRPTIRRSRAS